MRFTMSFSLDNAAFDNYHCNQEIARILGSKAAALDHPGRPVHGICYVQDVNGDCIGTVVISNE